MRCRIGFSPLALFSLLLIFVGLWFGIVWPVSGALFGHRSWDYPGCDVWFQLTLLGVLATSFGVIATGSLVGDSDARYWLISFVERSADATAIARADVPSVAATEATAAALEQLVPILDLGDDTALSLSKSLLESAGIPCVAISELGTGVWGRGTIAGGNRIAAFGTIMVRSEDMDAARQLLSPVSQSVPRRVPRSQRLIAAALMLCLLVSVTGVQLLRVLQPFLEENWSLCQHVISAWVRSR